jgi:PTH1 family peptidyl-tRNA hydrolase
MNLSGTAVRGWADWLKVLPEEILVVLDDVALPWGRLRFRCGGSSGGHNGLLSIETALASDRYPRLRCGVGPVPPLWDRKDFVLARLPASDEAAWQEVLAQGAEAIRYCLGQGIELAMNVFNRRAEKDSKES